MGKFRIKIDNEKTTLADVEIMLAKIKRLNIREIPLNEIRKILRFLGVTEEAGGGSIIRFQSDCLEGNNYYRGWFTIHIVHKGGNKQMINRRDFATYMFNPLMEIIDCLKNRNKN